MLTEFVDSVPRYPEIRVRTASRNPYALVAAVRFALRRARIGRAEIERFTREALESDDADASREVCRSWVEVENGSA